MSLSSELAELEAIHRSHGSALWRSWEPGPSADQIDQAVESAGLKPSVEIIRWISWHNGVTSPSGDGRGARLVPGADVLSLQQQVEALTMMRATARHVSESVGVSLTTLDFWRDTWWPLLDLFGGGYVLADLANPVEPGTPVRVKFSDSTPDEPAEAWPSLEQFVAEMNYRFRSKRYSIDDDGNVVGPWFDEART